jgi:GntR family transcriptional regulator
MAEWTGEPAYKQVVAAILRRIRDGKMKPGDKLPSIQAMMDEFEVSITTARRALVELRALGAIQTHQGKGAFVRDGAMVPPPGSEDFREAMRLLDAVQDDVRRLEARVAELERRDETSAPPPAPTGGPPAPRGRRSAR